MTSHITPLTHRAGPEIPAASQRRGVRIASASLVAALLLGVAIWTFRPHAIAPLAAEAPPPTVTVSPPLQRSVTAATEFTGQFSAVDQVELRAQVSGYLTEIHVNDGQMVRRGDLLFVIDPRPYDIALQQAAAQYQSAVAALDLANKQVGRSTELVRENFASREVLDQRVQAQLAATAAIQQAQAAIHAAQLNLDFTRITAPFAGRVSMRRVSIGSLIGGGTALTSLVSLDPLHLDFDMSEADYLAYERAVGRAQGAAPDVPFSLSDETGFPRHGTLDFIDNAVDRSSGTMHARASVANADLLIAPGQFARLRLPIGAARPVLLVPDAAIVTDQSRKLLMVVSADGSVTPKPVEIGALQDGQLRVITAGLAPSDQVIVNGLMRLRPGAKVTPQPGHIAPALHN